VPVGMACLPWYEQVSLLKWHDGLIVHTLLCSNSMTSLVSIHVSVSQRHNCRDDHTHSLSPQTGLDEIREAYRRKLETLMRDVQDLGRAVAIMQVSGVQ
jgi:hypothetical protein